MPAPGKTRAELRRRYKETPRQAGIFQVKNSKTGRIFLGSSTNLHLLQDADERCARGWDIY